MSNLANNNNKPTVQKGVRQADVAQLAEAILQDDTMNLPMIPDVVKRVIYQSTIKLTFNLFYKGISQLDGAGLVTSGSFSSSSRELQLERSFVEDGALLGIGEQQRNWQSFQSSIDMKPLENLASLLLKNKAVNVTVIPDSLEKEVYVNCLKIIFWILNIITSNIKITFCGHTISMGMAPTSTNYFNTTRGGNHQQTADAIIKQINSFMVNPNTIQEFSQQAIALLKMDGNSIGTDGSSSGGGKQRKSGVKNGLAFLKNSLNRVQEEMIKSLNTSLYGLILAIVDDLLSCTKIEILNDQISLKVASSSSSSQNKANDNNWNGSYPPPPPLPTSNHNNSNRTSHAEMVLMDDVSLAVEATMADLHFDQQRAILRRRFQQWTPEERALILQLISK